MLSASEAFIAVVAPLVDLVPVAEEVVDEVDEEVEVVEVVEVVFVPAVPPSTALPGRLTAAFAARAWKFARVRVAFAVGLFVLLVASFIWDGGGGRTYLTLITMVIPLWQCFPCEQYNQIGVVLLI
jgi:hypothetical protein